MAPRRRRRRARGEGRAIRPAYIRGRRWRLGAVAAPRGREPGPAGYGGVAGRPRLPPAVVACSRPASRRPAAQAAPPSTGAQSAPAGPRSTVILGAVGHRRECQRRLSLTRMQCTSGLADLLCLSAQDRDIRGRGRTWVRTRRTRDRRQRGVAGDQRVEQPTAERRPRADSFMRAEVGTTTGNRARGSGRSMPPESAMTASMACRHWRPEVARAISPNRGRGSRRPAAFGTISLGQRDTPAHGQAGST
jgi:hypothetical protein